jgi:hypothetical protein
MRIMAMGTDPNVNAVGFYNTDICLQVYDCSGKTIPNCVFLITIYRSNRDGKTHV